MSRRSRAATAISTLAAAGGLALAVSASAGAPALAATSCTGVQINPGDNLAARVNSDLGKNATTFCLNAAAGGTTYSVTQTVQLGAGDKLIGPTGTIVTRGPASYGVPLVKITGPTSLSKVIQVNGPNTQVSWLDISGGEIAIGAAKSNGSGVLSYLAIHNTARAGIGSMNGNLTHSNLYNNSQNPSFWGYNAAAVKGTDEYQAAFNYIHDNQANGVWCDVGCKDSGAALMPNGFWVHDNLIVKNGRWGVRYEYSPMVSSGVHMGNPSALIENNQIHANGYIGSGGYGGASMWDAQNGTFRNNTFGAATIGGVTYKADSRNRAILFFDSGRRTDLWNGTATGNITGGETITGCATGSSVVRCASNVS